MAETCSPPKSQRVRDYWRRRGQRRRGRPLTSKTGSIYVVKRAGRVVSRHRTLTAAVQTRKRLDLQAWRRGEGRPYDVERIPVTVTVT